MPESRRPGTTGTARVVAVAAVRWLRPWLYGLTVVLVLTDVVSDVLDLGPGVPGPVLLVAAAVALSTEPLRWLVTRNGGGTEPGPVEVAPPVTGRWSALNSPADKVPSHGVRAYGQAYAIDVLRESGEGERVRPAFGWWPPARRNGAFPAFGEPVLAVADATVVRVRDGRRDHLSRNSFPALPFFFLEASLRDTAGVGAIVGNHLVLDLGNGTYALYAHLGRGSAEVREGERVRTGQVIARVGNSGNSTEPHLHFQLMDAADPYTARGVPFTWRGVGVPANGEEFTA
ncbi:peptidoglycan DD-metalloendopeptidase family protein [Streptomyces sp. TRM43335]|uniref:Peptidoglycan DD-metalloendopeptidase family protein n=1 Tax=Streptomyces taklimakanensis TaxID=2569853 RepID=A0A6G2BDT1_9ACTN|nr:M23 family metallopeptidase [Streptomyces taklimakanensis]MTE20062.1 peptidoglycan DD-metalloendopeptidase family protein [Streptomyces taklimakanensis]